MGLREVEGFGGAGGAVEGPGKGGDPAEDGPAEEEADEGDEHGVATVAAVGDPGGQGGGDESGGEREKGEEEPEEGEHIAYSVWGLGQICL